MSWELLLQYDAEDLNFRFQSDSLQVDINALHKQYHIEPKGGVNEVNKQLLLQKAISRKQIFANSAWISQPELDKSILELDDPSLIKRVFTDPNQKAQDEQTDEAKNLPALIIGAPIPVTPGQNYPLRIGVIMQYIQKATQSGQQIPPDGKQAMMARLSGLVQADMQQDQNGGKALGKQIQDYLASIGWVPPQGQQAPQAGPMPAPR